MSSIRVSELDPPVVSRGGRSFDFAGARIRTEATGSHAELIVEALVEAIETRVKLERLSEENDPARIADLLESVLAFDLEEGT